MCRVIDPKSEDWTQGISQSLIDRGVEPCIVDRVQSPLYDKMLTTATLGMPTLGSFLEHQDFGVELQRLNPYAYINVHRQKKIPRSPCEKSYRGPSPVLMGRESRSTKGEDWLSWCNSSR